MFSIRRLVVGGAIVAAVVVVAAVAGWWFLVREDNSLASSAPAVPAELKETPPSGAGRAGTSDAPPGGALAFKIIPERSEAAYFANEKLASLPLPSTAKGSTNAIEGTFYLTPDGRAFDPTRPSTFTVDLRTLRSDKEMRDRRVQNDGLQTSTYPTATFTATRLSGYDPGIPEGQEQALQLTGIMDLHGVQKEITWDVKARHEGNVITALATVNFKYADFNIPVLNVANFVSVEDNVTLQVQIVAQAV